MCVREDREGAWNEDERTAGTCENLVAGVFPQLFKFSISLFFFILSTLFPLSFVSSFTEKDT